MKLYTSDVECFYSSDYTLKKMTTEEYTRDRRFKIHCVGVKEDNGTCKIYDKPPEFLNGQAILGHHQHFDCLVYSHWYGIVPGFIFDTLSMARLVLPHLKSHSLQALAEYYGLGTKTVDYGSFIGKRDLDPETQRNLEEGCKHDVELTYEIFKRLLPYVSKEELQIIDLTIRMFTEPALELERQSLSVYLEEIKCKKREALERLGIDPSELSSSNKFAAILSSLGVEPPTKISPRTGKETYALAKTDAGFKALLEHENETVQALAAARLGVKSTINETRCERLLSSASRGPLPVYLKYFGAHTGRWSGGDSLNWQNFPRTGEIRKSILAPEGYVLVVVDLSQIECRMLNWLAGQEDVLQAFRSGRDLYCEAASRFYGRTITKADKIERQIFKSVELGCGYGMGAKKFREYARQSGSPVSEAVADELIKFYRHTHENVCRYWRSADTILQILLNTNRCGDTWGPMELRGDTIIKGPGGSFLCYNGLQKTEDGYKYITRGHESKVYGCLVVENVVQWLSRILLAQAMLKIAKSYKIVMSTHDEVVFLAPEGEAEQAHKFGMECLTTNPDWCNTLPLAAEGGYARSYSK